VWMMDEDERSGKGRMRMGMMDEKIPQVTSLLITF
jgi:hypothetical protein